MRIHPSAIVHPKAELADDVEVQAFSIIEAGVQIGAGTVVGPHCVVAAGTRVGDNNRFYSGAQIGIVPQDLKHKSGAVGKTVLGNGNVIREFVTISSSTVYGDEEDDHKVTVLGDNCLLMACSHVAHDCILGDGVIMANSVALAGHVEVRSHAVIGGLTGIHQFVVIGQMAFVGGMSRISKDVPPYMIVEGHTPSKCYGPNKVGLERNGLDKAAIGRIRAMFKVLYRSDLNTQQALERIEATIEDCEERQVILDFYRNSNRGVI